jgi:hypothetical protein
MSTVEVPCPVAGCGCAVPVDKSRHDDSDSAELIGLWCPQGHVFDYAKDRCPRCKSPMSPAERRRVQSFWADDNPRGLGERLPIVFHRASCTNPKCDYEGPRQE